MGRRRRGKAKVQEDKATSTSGPTTPTSTPPGPAGPMEIDKDMGLEKGIFTGLEDDKQDEDRDKACLLCNHFLPPTQVSSRTTMTTSSGGVNKDEDVKKKDEEEGTEEDGFGFEQIWELLDMDSVMAMTREEREVFASPIPSLCPVCSEMLSKISEVVTHIKELEESLSELRKEIRGKIKESATDEEKLDMAMEQEVRVLPLKVEFPMDDVAIEKKMRKKLIHEVVSGFLLMLSKGRVDGRKKSRRVVKATPVKVKKEGGTGKATEKKPVLKRDIINSPPPSPVPILETRLRQRKKKRLEGEGPIISVGDVEVKLEVEDVEDYQMIEVPEPGSLPPPSSADDNEEEEAFYEGTVFAPEDDSDQEWNYELGGIEDWGHGGEIYSSSEDEDTESSHDSDSNEDDSNDTEEPGTKRKRSRKEVAKVPITLIGADGEEMEGLYHTPSSKKKRKEGTPLPVLTPPEEGDTVRVDAPLLPPGFAVKCPYSKTSECDKTFKSINTMKKHVRQTHEVSIDRPFYCPICQERFRSLNGMRMHHRENHGKIDTSIFPHLRSSKTPHAPKTFICDVTGCSKAYSKNQHLQTHIRIKHTKETPYTCEHCPQQHSTIVQKEMHVERYHPEVPPLKCHFCPRGYYRDHRLNHHIASHTGEGIICELCGKTFRTASFLRYHKITNHQTEGELHKCTDCDKSFAIPSHLTAHIREKHAHPIHCEVCGQGLSHPSRVKVHMRKHTGEKPFNCPICSRGCRTQGDLNWHVQTHDKERPRPFGCPICHKTFTASYKLKRHELTHGEPTLFCDCGKAFIRKDYFNQHRKSCGKNVDSK